MVLKCGFCKNLLLYECNSDQLPTFFLFFIPFRWVQQQTHQKVMIEWKKWATGQICIHKEVTSYKIHTLVEKFEKIVSKIVLTFCEKKMFLWLRKTYEIRGWKLGICKTFEITSTVKSTFFCHFLLQSGSTNFFTPLSSRTKLSPIYV